MVTQQGVGVVLPLSYLKARKCCGYQISSTIDFYAFSERGVVSVESVG